MSFKAGDNVLVLIPHECGHRCEYTHEQRRGVVVTVAPCIYDESVPMYLVTTDSLWCAWLLDDDDQLQPDPETRSIGIKLDLIPPIG